jgi:hypothetical protein
MLLAGLRPALEESNVRGHKALGQGTAPPAPPWRRGFQPRLLLTQDYCLAASGGRVKKLGGPPPNLSRVGFWSDARRSRRGSRRTPCTADAPPAAWEADPSKNPTPESIPKPPLRGLSPLRTLPRIEFATALALDPLALACYAAMQMIDLC